MAEALDLQYRILTLKLQETIAEERGDMFYSVLDDLSPESRLRISEQKIKGRSSFFLACQLSRLEFAAHFIKHCQVDINQLSTFEYNGYDHEVTPLWMACYNNNKDLVHLLVENGADVNAVSEGGSTPSLVACQTDALEIVTYLSENNADLNIPDENGVTCLRESLDNEDLCRYVLSRDINVNFHLPGQYPILHCAINLKQLPIVELLLNAGCDALVADFDGNDALTYAAIQMQPEIIEYIIKCTSPDVEHVINTYELLGAMLIDKNEMEEGLEFWDKAMTMRYKDKDEPILKKKIEYELVFQGITEVQNMQELEAIKHAPRKLGVQCLYVRERVLGPTHPDTLYKVLSHGIMLSYELDYGGALVILGYAFDMFMKKNNPLHEMVAYTMSQRIRMLYECVLDLQTEGITPPVDDIMKSFEEIVEMIEKSYKLKAEDDTFLIRHKKSYNSVLIMTLELLYLISHIKLDYEEDVIFTKIMKKLQHTDPRNLFKQSLLHIAYVTEAKSTRASKLRNIQNWHPYLTNVLLQNGSDVNSRDIFRDTPLLTFLKKNTALPIVRIVVSILLSYEAHVDCYNVHGETALSLMREIGHDVCEVRYTTLKCLSARVIARHNIFIPGYIPLYMIDFVRLHENIKDNEDEIQNNADNGIVDITQN